MFKLDENPNWVKEVESQLETGIGTASSTAFAFLFNQLTEAGGDRTGNFYEFLPRQSSAFGSGEYPQEQSGNLLSSVALEPGDDSLMFHVGFFYEYSNKEVYDSGNEGDLISISASDFDDILRYLEFGRPDRENGPLFMTFEGENSVEVHADMNRSAFGVDSRSPLPPGTSGPDRMF